MLDGPDATKRRQSAEWFIALGRLVAAQTSLLVDPGRQFGYPANLGPCCSDSVLFNLCRCHSSRAAATLKVARSTLHGVRRCVVNSEGKQETPEPVGPRQRGRERRMNDFRNPSTRDRGFLTGGGETIAGSLNGIHPDDRERSAQPSSTPSSPPASTRLRIDSGSQPSDRTNALKIDATRTSSELERSHEC